MEQEKLYVIEEKTYEAHIDEEVHLYGLIHQLAFLAGKISLVKPRITRTCRT